MNDNDDRGTQRIAKAMSEIGTEEPPDGPLAKHVATSRRKKRANESIAVVDPIAELRQRRLRHQFMTKQMVRLGHMVADRKFDSGETWVNPMPLTQKSDLVAAQKSIERGLAELKSGIDAELKKVPIYQHFLSRAYGGKGTIVAMYLVTSIDIHKCEKPGNLLRYCGNVPDPATGMLERRREGCGPKASGGNGTFNQSLRTILHQLDSSMSRNAVKFTVCEKHATERPSQKAKVEEKRIFRATTAQCRACQATDYPFGNTSKYLQVKEDYIVRMASHPRIDWSAGTIRDFRTGEVMTNADRKTPRSPAMFVIQTARRKMLDVFLEDLYVIWRAMEGLPVWPDWYAGKLGYAHGGKIVVDKPRLLTLEEAEALVGDPGKRARAGLFIPPGRVAIAEAAEDAED